MRLGLLPVAPSESREEGSRREIEYPSQWDGRRAGPDRNLGNNPLVHSPREGTKETSQTKISSPRGHEPNASRLYARTAAAPDGARPRLKAHRCPLKPRSLWCHQTPASHRSISGSSHLRALLSSMEKSRDSKRRKPKAEPVTHISAKPIASAALPTLIRKVN